MSQVDLTLNDLYKRIDETIKSGTQKTDVETLVNEAMEFSSAAFDNSDQMVRLTSRHTNKIKLSEELEVWLNGPAKLMTIM